MASLAEKYRPQTLAEVVGQPKAVAQVAHLLSRGVGGKALWITGKTGQGKSTLAGIIARSVAEDWSIQEMDAQRATPARICALEAESHVSGMGAKAGRAIIVNEAHGLSGDAVNQLLVTLERIPRHVVWIFTTTADRHDQLLLDGKVEGKPLVHRCLPISLAERGQADPFAVRLHAIAVAEGLDGGKPLAWFKRLINDNGGSMRAGLAEVEACAAMVLEEAAA